MAKRLLNFDKSTGKETWLHDNVDGGFTVEQKQHVKQVIETAKVKANEYERGSLIGNTQRHWQQVAEIPSSIYLELRQRFGDRSHACLQLPSPALVTGKYPSRNYCAVLYFQRHNGGA